MSIHRGFIVLAAAAAFSLSAAPERAAWALMLLGFGGLGARPRSTPRATAAT